MEKQKNKIMICDDSITSRKKLKECILKKDDFDIIEACNGTEAVNFYKTFVPHLVFMDIIMPFKDGTVATKEIIDLDKNAKIIILSSVGTKENLKKTLTYGAIDFIQKPWNEMQIHNILEKLVLKGE